MAKWRIHWTLHDSDTSIIEADTEDDAQIVRASIEKAYEINGEGRAEIWVREIV